MQEHEQSCVEDHVSDDDEQYQWPCTSFGIVGIDEVVGFHPVELEGALPDESGTWSVPLGALGVRVVSDCEAVTVHGPANVGSQFFELDQVLDLGDDIERLRTNLSKGGR